MKKIFYFTLATFALLAVSSCEKNLDIPQKGVTAIETFYKTDEDCEAALVAAYAQLPKMWSPRMVAPSTRTTRPASTTAVTICMPPVPTSVTTTSWPR